MVDLQLESEERQCGDAKKIEREPIHIGFWTQNNMFQGQKYIVLIECERRDKMWGCKENREGGYT